jgi:hypothetical protein
MCGIAFVHGMPPQRLGDRDRVEGAGQGPDIPGSTQPRDELGLDQRDAAREKRYRQAGPGQLAQSLPGFAEISAPVLVAVMGPPAGSATDPVQVLRGLAPRASETGDTNRKGRPMSTAGPSVLRATCSAPRTPPAGTTRSWPGSTTCR